MMFRFLAVMAVLAAVGQAFVQDVVEIRRVFNMVDPETCGCRPAAECGMHIPQASTFGVRCAPSTAFCCQRRRPGQPVASFDEYARRFSAARHRRPAFIRNFQTRTNTHQRSLGAENKSEMTAPSILASGETQKDNAYAAVASGNGQNGKTDAVVANKDKMVAPTVVASDENKNENADAVVYHRHHLPVVKNNLASVGHDNNNNNNYKNSASFRPHARVKKQDEDEFKVDAREAVSVATAGGGGSNLVVKTAQEYYAEKQSGNNMQRLSNHHRSDPAAPVEAADDDDDDHAVVRAEDYSACSCREEGSCRRDEEQSFTFARSCGHGSIRCCKKEEEEAEIVVVEKEEVGGERVTVVRPVGLPHPLVEAQGSGDDPLIKDNDQDGGSQRNPLVDTEDQKRGSEGDTLIDGDQARGSLGGGLTHPAAKPQGLPRDAVFKRKGEEQNGLIQNQQQQNQHEQNQEHQLQQEEQRRIQLQQQQQNHRQQQIQQQQQQQFRLQQQQRRRQWQLEQARRRRLQGTFLGGVQLAMEDFTKGVTSLFN